MHSVRPIPSLVGRDYIVANHYTHGCHNRPTCFGLFYGEEMQGVIAFATPCSEAVRASIYGKDRKSEVTELHRMHIRDDAHRLVGVRRDGKPVDNTASWFIARALRLLPERITCVISFADSTEGHTGGVYRAAGFVEAGSTGKATFYRDADGRLRHPRQCGVNITKEEALSRGWTPEQREAKTRWLWFRTRRYRKQSRYA